MNDAFSWHCPYCNRATTITGSNFSTQESFFNQNNKEGTIVLRTTLVACPNPECREYSLHSKLLKGTVTKHGTWGASDEVLQSWRLRPSSSAKPMPIYIPAPLVDDYNEACLIRDLSPKASATLSRRCLQGMIRDFWGESKPTLYKEIEAIKDRVDSDTWDAIDAVRSLGNIGAHMEKDINVIVDVDPTEAQHLINLIELLIEDWYVTRHDRAQRKKAVVDAANSKKSPPAATS